MIPGCFWGGMWLFPILILVVMVVIVYLIFGRVGYRPPWDNQNRHLYYHSESNTALEILKNRYAKGEITKEEFEQMKKNIIN